MSKEDELGLPPAEPGQYAWMEKTTFNLPLHDLFAMFAPENPDLSYIEDDDERATACARWALKYADAVMKEREERRGEDKEK